MVLAAMGGGDRVDGAHTQGAERTRPKRPQRVHRRHHRVPDPVQEQATRRGEGQDGAQCSVQRLNLDLAVAWKTIRALKREGEERRERKIVGIRKVDVGSLGVRYR